MSQAKDFEKASLYKPTGEELSGHVTLDDYRARTEEKAQQERLLDYGLTEEEMHLKLEAEEGQVQ